MVQCDDCGTYLAQSADERGSNAPTRIAAHWCWIGDTRTWVEER